MLIFENIAIGYGRVLVRSGLIQLDKGKVYGFIGPNGSGKTTTLNSLMGCTPLLAGEIYWNGVSTAKLTTQQCVKIFSFVPSRLEGIRNLTVGDLIGMGRMPHTNLLDVRKKEDEELVDEVISLLQIEHIRNKCTTEISDGERQIAMIGKALAQQTDVIILDEPTAFLDYRNRRKVLSVLTNTAKQLNKTILFTTHDMELAHQMVDEFIAILPESKSLEIISKELSFDEIVLKVFPMNH
jgi:iron complex transport system ATP-binding protein